MLFCFVCFFAFVVIIDQSTVWKVISNLQGVSIPYTPPPPPHPLQKGVEIARDRSLKCPLEKGQGTILDEELYIVLPLKPYVGRVHFSVTFLHD